MGNLQHEHLSLYLIMRLLIVSTIILFSYTACGDDTYADVYSGTKVRIEADELPADSVSTTVITTSLEDALSKNQEVLVSTSHGGILVPPYDFSEIPQKEVLIKPFSDKFEVLLIANTLDTADQVFVTIGIDSFFIEEEEGELKFSAALPEDMQFQSNARIVNTQDAAVNIVADLYRSSGYVSNGLRFYPSAVIESIDTAQTDSLLWSLPRYVKSKNNSVKVPITILRHVPGTQLRVSLSTDRAVSGHLECSMVLFTE